MLADAASCLPLPDAVLGIPQHEDHLRRRGYNQAHELAVALGLLLSLPVRPGLLRRPADSPHQTGLTAAQRQRTAAGSSSRLRFWQLAKALAPMEVTDWPDSMSKRTLAVFCASTGPRKLS